MQWHGGVLLSYYYIRDVETRAPRCTVCLGVNIAGEVARGIALCSTDDAINKKEGKRLARIRCFKALGTRTDHDEVDLSLSKVNGMLGGLDGFIPSDFFAEFDPVLGEFEERIVNTMKGVIYGGAKVRGGSGSGEVARSAGSDSSS